MPAYQVNLPDSIKTVKTNMTSKIIVNYCYREQSLGEEKELVFMKKITMVLVVSYWRVCPTVTFVYDNTCDVDNNIAVIF